MSEGLILIVDDEEHIRELVRLYLEKEGFTVALAADGEEAVQKAKSTTPQLIILDLMLPKLDGWDVCREVRKFSEVPIIMLTAKGEEFDKVLGLELGADDYLTKPFSPRELVARVKAILRRATPEEQTDTEDVLTFPGLAINHSSREVHVDDREVTLTPKEFDLLWFLATHPGKVFTREQLLTAVWGYDYYGDLRTVDTHIKRLREKVERDGNTPHVKTIWGVGYKFEVQEK
ncbi:response regulator transcription factor [Dethiobacter alkaliphilus]|uniref:Two component transcriptional regulator, winged helix family n=1 Tax=Dethiobacter alkaliphilus AHT 1 TaxID=555088 RepID=C0GBZ3_DETAL|nr:response regulator transcription factor [Dethiobacter alkaliphilus]EEG78728.1 two component transcriptional regulator, winged helix family [Dethiobacter alkaliphilus AHT 1]